MSNELLADFRQDQITAEIIDSEYSRKIQIAYDMLKPNLSLDGNMWCCIWGELPEKQCIVGFGKTPEKAINNFYRNYMGFPTID